MYRAKNLIPCPDMLTELITNALRLNLIPAVRRYDRVSIIAKCIGTLFVKIGLADLAS